MSKNAQETVGTVVAFLMGVAVGVMATNSSDDTLAVVLVYLAFALSGLIGLACWFYSLGHRRGSSA